MRDKIKRFVVNNMSEANSFVINTYKCAAALLPHGNVKGGFKGGILHFHTACGQAFLSQEKYED
jgi:hypothetical protein